MRSPFPTPCPRGPRTRRGVPRGRAIAAATSVVASSWWPSTVTSTAVVSLPDAVSAAWRQHQRRAATRPPSSMKITSPTSGAARSPEPRSVNDSAPVANRTVVTPVTSRRSKTATGNAYRMLTRLPQSTSVLIEGSEPCLVRRRRSASAADRYVVGVDAEVSEDAAPGRETRHVRQRRGAEPGTDRGLLGCESLDERRRWRAVRQPDGVEHATDHPREPFDDGRVIPEQDRAPERGSAGVRLGRSVARSATARASRRASR